MPRPVRVHLPGSLYLVTCKAAEGLSLFKDSADFETYAAFLKTYREQYGFKLFAYALVPGEAQLLVELASEKTISEIMHALNSRYTKHFVKRYDHMGHVFQERFRSVLIEKTPTSLFELTAVVHRLPQESGNAPEASTYRWSSYSAYLAGGESDAIGLHREVAEVMAAAKPGISFQAAMKSMADSVFSYWRAELAHSVVGSEAFHQLVQDKSNAVKVAKLTALAQMNAPAQPQSANDVKSVFPVFAASAAVALLSLGIVVTALLHQANLRQTVQILSQQVESSVSQMAGGGNQENSKKIATYAMAAQLSGTSWDIQVSAADGIGAKPAQEDELLFDSGKVASKVLSGQGFSATNYSLTLEPDGTVKWETMATGKSGEIICWQGQVSGQQMQGMMTRQLPGQAALNFNFHGIAKPMQEAMHRTVREA